MWDVCHPFNCLCLNHLFLIMVTGASGHGSGLWTETRVPGANHKRRTCERRTQTHNLPALKPLNCKQRKRLSDWLVFYFICLLFVFLAFCFWSRETVECSAPQFLSEPPHTSVLKNHLNFIGFSYFSICPTTAAESTNYCANRWFLHQWAANEGMTGCTSESKPASLLCNNVDFNQLSTVRKNTGSTQLLADPMVN